MQAECFSLGRSSGPDPTVVEFDAVFTGEITVRVEDSAAGYRF
jgi:hypothetical protein